MFARTLTALFLCAAPALAAPPEAPMPRAAGVPFPAPPHPMWYDSEECLPEQLQLWHRMNFNSVYSAPFLSYQAQRDGATRRSNPVSFAFPRQRFFIEAECMKRYLESVRFAPQAPADVPTPFSFIEWTDLLLGAPPKAPCRSAWDTYDGVIQRAYGEEFARAAKSRRLRDEFVALHKSAADAPPASADPLVCPPCPLPKIEVNPLLGTWYREVPGCVACATFTHDELKLTFAESDGTKHTATAQYTVTKDGLVFGAITGTTGPASLVDVPFSFRFRVTSDGVMVSAFKSEPMGDTARFCGLFKCAKDGKVPAPVAAKPALGAAVGTGLLPPNAGSNVGAPLIDPVRPAALETPPVVLPPVLDGPPPMPPARPKASAPTDASKLFAEDAFGALLQQSGVLPRSEPLPFPSELPCAPAKKLAHVGTWHRELGPMTCVVKIDAEHVTLTACLSGEEKGKKVKQGVVITGDYHLSRDGTALVGLVTGLDVIFEGDGANDADLLDGLDQVAKLQKALVGQPFALSVRAYGDALVIGDVRVAQASDRVLGESSAMIAGRYKSGEPKGAEPKRLPRATGATGAFIPLAQSYSADPEVRTQQLHSQSDDLRQIQNEWRRFWFNDQPKHLTPERVHGGNY